MGGGLGTINGALTGWENKLQRTKNSSLKG